MEETKYLKEKLFNDKKNGWFRMTDEVSDKIMQYAEEYMYFINRSKTEKEAFNSVKDILIKNGFVDIAEKEELLPGDKVFFGNRNRSIYIAVIGSESLLNGVRAIGAHIDSPRIDLKQNPLYEENEFAMFKTQYYGGIKKYQWTNIPLAMHGIFVKPTGEKINVVIGEDEEDPVFTISDLLPHLAQDQLARKLSEGVKGEELNILVGSRPYDDESITEAVKLNILKLLNDKYGITEIDFTSSEIEFVPALKARSIGLDSSMVGGYGQDDRSCSYAALRGILNLSDLKKTAVCILTDKEEIGFMGNTGMESRTFDYFMAELLNKTNSNKPNALEEMYSKSKVISADVDAAYDPTYASVFEKRNSAFMGKGVTIVKFGGVKGKANASEASCEMVAELRDVYDKAGVKYQSSQLHKVDQGGGGTIAMVLANKGMDVIDSGIPILGMHSPYEISSKYDLYQAFIGYEAFYRYE